MPGWLRWKMRALTRRRVEKGWVKTGLMMTLVLSSNLPAQPALPGEAGAADPAGNPSRDSGQQAEMLSLFDFLGAMVEDSHAGWLDPLDLHDVEPEPVPVEQEEAQP